MRSSGPSYKQASQSLLLYLYVWFQPLKHGPCVKANVMLYAAKWET